MRTLLSGRNFCIKSPPTEDLFRDPGGALWKQKFSTIKTRSEHSPSCSKKGDEVRKGLLEFARTNRFADAHLSGVGAFREVTMGFFDRQQKKYSKIPIKEQVEVLSFTGNVIQNDGKPSLHAHVVIGKADGTAHGGHFLGGRVWPAREMILSGMPVIYGAPTTMKPDSH